MTATPEYTCNFDTCLRTNYQFMHATAKYYYAIVGDAYVYANSEHNTEIEQPILFNTLVQELLERIVYEM